MVPDVSKLGWDEVGMGGSHCGVVLSFVIWVPRHQQQLGTWFPLVGAVGFHGGGSHFCACGHLFVFILGCLPLFVWLSLLSGWSWIVVGIGRSLHCVIVVCGH